MAQQSYKQDLDVGVRGGVSAVGGEVRVVPLEAAVAITPGLALSFTADGKVTNVGSATLAYAGIALDRTIGEPNGTDEYAAGDIVPCAQVHSVFCELTGANASVVGGAVYRVIATGAITAVASGTTTALIPNARFESATPVGALADVRLG
ncbi:MAG: hypothetical protein K0U66_04185 [Gammaproteobacteria bacterium]|nr:hypothetical protein [Gammaproteobacteria bacterium]